MATRKAATTDVNGTANLGFEARLWAGADALRNQGADADDADDYPAESFIWVPRVAR